MLISSKQLKKLVMKKKLHRFTTGYQIEEWDSIFKNYKLNLAELLIFTADTQ